MVRNKEIVKAENLSVHFKRKKKIYKALDHVDFTVNKGEIVSVVGESGSGKTTLGRTLIGLISRTTGTVTIDDKLVPSKKVEFINKKNKWIYSKAQMIFQNPTTSLNEVKKIKEIIGEGIKNLNLYDVYLADKKDDIKKKLQVIDDKLVKLENPWLEVERKHTTALSKNLQNLKAKKINDDKFLFGQIKIIKTIDDLREQILDEKELFEVSFESAQRYKKILKEDRRTSISNILDNSKYKDYDIKVSLEEELEELENVKKYAKNTFAFKRTVKWTTKEINERINYFEDLILDATKATKRIKARQTKEKLIGFKTVKQNKINRISYEKTILNEILKIFVKAKRELKKLIETHDRESVKDIYIYLRNINVTVTEALVAFETWRFDNKLLEESKLQKTVKYYTNTNILKKEKLLSKQFKILDLKAYDTELKNIDKEIKRRKEEILAKMNSKIAVAVGKVKMAPIDLALYKKRDNYIQQLSKLNSIKSNRLDEKEFINQKITEILKKVGLDESALNKYPSQFSGGQKQRIGIARSILVNPEFIVADEPISALDVSLQASVVNLLKDLQKEFKMAIMFISHDIEMSYYISNRIAVMYQGKIVEMGTAKSVYENPIHPYTKALINAQPNIKKPGQKLKLNEYDSNQHNYNDYKIVKEWEARKGHWVYGTKKEVQKWSKNKRIK